MIVMEEIKMPTLLECLQTTFRFDVVQFYVLIKRNIRSSVEK